jgi:hypothetical protein
MKWTQPSSSMEDHHDQLLKGGDGKGLTIVNHDGYHGDERKGLDRD